MLWRSGLRKIDLNHANGDPQAITEVSRKRFETIETPGGEYEAEPMLCKYSREGGANAGRRASNQYDAATVGELR
jgi:hypothetical protein